MIVMDVISHEGMQITDPLRAQFDETGGSIGRGDTNKLVLPDPERRISRVHAIIVYQNGQYWVQDKGSAIRIQLNGKDVGQGGQSPIKAGDKLTIGGYTLAITDSQDEQEAVTQIHSNTAYTSNPSDELLNFSDSSSSIDDPFADLISQKGGNEQSPKANKENGDLSSAYDAQAGTGGSHHTFEKLPDDLFESVISSQQSTHSISKIFGLDDQDNGSNLLDLENNFSYDENADSNELLTPLSPPNEHASRRGKQSTVMADNVLEVNSYFSPPKVSGHSEAEIVNESQMSRDDPNMVLSWENQQDDQGEIKTVIIKGGAKSLDSTPTQEQKVLADDEGKRATQPVQDSSVQEAKGSGSGPLRPSKEVANDQLGDDQLAGDNPDLLKAFLIGAGIPDLKNASELTPETMQKLGQIFRTMVQGTLDLLLARATIKQEVRAEMTMIVARENNPLKFSPNAEAALNHLLSPSQRGFMEPLAAIEDAYDDLRSHQFGFMAGMRAALKDVLLRFNPERLERRLEERNVIDTLLPMSRKARLWNLFENLYGDISHEAEEDFHALFGKEFVKAYEAQVSKLEQDKK